MTLEQNIREIEDNYPDLYEVLCDNVPDLIDNPSSPSEEDLEEYNYWIDSIDGDVSHLFHFND